MLISPTRIVRFSNFKFFVYPEKKNRDLSTGMPYMYAIRANFFLKKSKKKSNMVIYMQFDQFQQDKLKLGSVYEFKMLRGIYFFFPVLMDIHFNRVVIIH